MVAHGLITGMLFFVAGSAKDRYHTLDISRLGGMLKQAPRMGWILGFTAMASLGLPGLAGFWGEFPAILSAYNPGGDLNEALFRVYMVVAAVGTVFAAGYLLWLFQRVAFGTPDRGVRERRSHPRRPADGMAGMGADAGADRHPRHLPQHHLPRHRPARDPRRGRDRTPPGRRDLSSRCSLSS